MRRSSFYLLILLVLGLVILKHGTAGQNSNLNYDHVKNDTKANVMGHVSVQQTNASNYRSCKNIK